jgi:hypothetical protein
MNTPSETIVVPTADVKKEPESKLAAVARKRAPKKARKAVKKAARKKATKAAITKATKRRPFPYQRVLKMWKAGKTMAVIARAVGRYQPKADDPLRSFRVSLTRFHKGVMLDGKLVKLPYRVSHKTVKLAIKAGKKASA